MNEPQYGRLLGYVFLPDGTFVNAELVKKGYAKVYTYPPNVSAL
ncbi:MAG: thermonuclease family protein [Planctomycetota bacterium]